MAPTALRAAAFVTGFGTFLAACAQTPLPTIQPPAPAEMRVAYACDNGEQVSVRYFPQQGIAVLERGGQNIEMNGTSTPPGFTYTAGPSTLRVAPDRLTMQINVGMMATANCKAR